MKIIILMAQRKCTYTGQYGPETLACMSEYEYSDNPEYLHNARQDNLDTNEFDAVELVTLEVSNEEINRRLFPVPDTIEAKVI